MKSLILVLGILSAAAVNAQSSNEAINACVAEKMAIMMSGTDLPEAEWDRRNDIAIRLCMTELQLSPEEIGRPDLPAPHIDPRQPDYSETDPYFDRSTETIINPYPNDIPYQPRPGIDLPVPPPHIDPAQPNFFQGGGDLRIMPPGVGMEF